MMLTSVIIPSRSPEYLQKTIDDLLAKAEGSIEVIVVLDGIWPEIPIKEDKRVMVLHHGGVHNSVGMRDSINYGVAVSHGTYLMKVDEHVMMDQGFDVKLAADCDDNSTIIPRRRRLNADDWVLIEDGRPPVDYMYIAYPYERPNDKTCGLHGAEWKERARERKDILIDETPSSQGSCYFMSRKHWDKVIGRLDSTYYGPFTQEAQEIDLKTWFTGGKVLVNKKTWYAHMHKGKNGKGYGFSNRQYAKHMEGTERGRLYAIDYWMRTKDFKYDWDWFMNKFPDMPGWGNDWKERILVDEPQRYVGVNLNENKN